MKRYLSLIFTVIILVCAASAAAFGSDHAGLGNFQRVRSYPAEFSDVKESDWFFSYVSCAYELGLVNGNSETFYNSDGSVSIAETIAVASRLHKIYYTGSSDFTEGTPWYQVYVDYAAANSIAGCKYADYNARATRAEYVTIISGALPDDAFEQITAIEANAVPDVPASASYAPAVYKLYRAGIIEGSDNKGTFNPGSNIRRSEVAAILTKIADTSRRESNKLRHLAPTDLFNSYKGLDVTTIPTYGGTPYVVINNNAATFTDDDLTTISYEYYGDLDSLGRCTRVCAVIGKDLMPTAERGSIGNVKPSGWQTARYDDLIEDKYLYNRCHLIGYLLTGENANEKNLITGTRSMNMSGMQPFENMVADYVKDSGNHVVYRVVPIFYGSELVARGVHIEAKSVEDKGRGICFNVFIYNVQPGIDIDYSDGSSAAQEKQPAVTGPKPEEPETRASAAGQPGDEGANGSETQSNVKYYILNTNTKKIHIPGACSAQDRMARKNRIEVDATLEELLEDGYTECKLCFD